MPWWLTLVLTVLILVVSMFCVIVEFSLLAARRHRLEETAERSMASRSALRSMNELTVMLAGAQLGITVATFALGAITKPAVHHALTPLLEMTGLPLVVADGASFVLALFVVTFLHLVVGEMAPKSWAIAHPETAARTVSIPARGFTAAFRPLLEWINTVANKLVARAGVEPVERAAAGGYDAATLRHLLEHSTQTGVLDRDAATRLAGVIGLGSTTVGELVARDGKPVTAVAHDATVTDVQRAAHRSGHFRILLHDAPDADGLGLKLVHVRDTLRSDGETPAGDFARDVLLLRAGTTMQAALSQLRQHHQQLAVVIPDEGEPELLGVLTAADLLDQLWPSIERGLSQRA